MATNYPGRASMSPILDVFITLLEMGRSGYRNILSTQKENFKTLLSGLEELAERTNTKVLAHNGISIAFAVESFGSRHLDPTEIGSMLFTRNISGILQSCTPSWPVVFVA